MKDIQTEETTTPSCKIWCCNRGCLSQRLLACKGEWNMESIQKWLPWQGNREAICNWQAYYQSLTHIRAISTRTLVRNSTVCYSACANPWWATLRCATPRCAKSLTYATSLNWRATLTSTKSGFLCAFASKFFPDGTPGQEQTSFGKKSTLVWLAIWRTWAGWGCHLCD